MCRILLQTGYDGSSEMYKRFEEALALMKHGGPDNRTIIERDGILFGHNRLSIIDLSDEANQPFETEKCIVLFNGEIYNYEKARILNRLDCNTESDTEVIAKMYEKVGMDFVKYLYGEYSIVIYDKNTKSINWVTDPSGVKPLYVNGGGNQDPVILASEQKALRHLDPALSDDIDEDSLSEFLQFGYTSESLYQEIGRCQKGKCEYSFKGNNYSTVEWHQDVPPPRGQVAEQASPNLIRHLVENAVKDRMRSDVPIACALSGGIDSAIVAYCMQKNTDKRIKTYTLGFKGLDNEFDEAKETAAFIGSDHYEIEIDPKYILKDIDDILDTMEEPIDRGSLIPTYFLAKNVKEKVILVGEGADEIFGGYKRHQKFMTESYQGDYEFLKEYYEVFNQDESREDHHYRSDFGGLNPMQFDLKNEIPYFHNARLDKCFMRFGIESRVPYLDQLLTQVALGVPFSEKVNPEKKILRQAFAGKIPDQILYRKKRPLKLPFEYMIEIEEVKENILGYDNPWIKKESIRAIYDSPADSRNRGRKLWAVFLINKWYERELTRGDSNRGM